MPDLRDLLRGAVDDPTPLDLDELAHRVGHDERRRRLAVIGAAAAVLVLVGAAAVALAIRAGDTDVDIAPIHPSPDAVPGSGTTALPSTSTPTTAETATTASTDPVLGITVPGGPGGAPPCAAPGAGQEGASTLYPDHAPLVTKASFAGGVRWAVCGADPTFAAQLLNLRSDDGGRSWSVTDTDLAMSPHNAGDRVDVQLASATTGTIHLVSMVGERDDRYATDDGGLHWRPVR
jgi:hypothetical protein